ncbi:DUF1707 and DUF2154 domain-containing protein [Streptomyces sp. HNM0574]|uniref:DUF1707 domain-containing protein n=1 Tax=Streptomyces sp. HNM0574 TaxID=2714954 RepID=UPI00146E3DAB|nr:DUF1707 domain-containing protein [Streptomyces sp. HNM0574]
MTDSPPEKKPAAAEVSVRASDADRDRVADILREALAEGRLDAAEHSERLDTVYAAKTVGELEPVVRDLPAGARTPEAPSQAPGSATFAYGEADARAGAKDDVAAIFSSATRKGRWRVPGKVNATAIFGSVEIDLTQAVFTQQHVQLNANAIFGSVEILVPENVTLQQKGAGIFGSFEVRTMESDEAAAPVVLVEGSAIFGSVEAKPKPGKWLRDLRDKFRKDV